MTKLREVLPKLKYNKHCFIDSESSVTEVVKAMSKINSNTLYVTQGDTLVGVFNLKDYFASLSSNDFQREDRKVKDIMNTIIPSISIEANIDDCILLMKKKHCSHIALTENGKLIGVACLDQLIEESLAGKKFLIEQLTSYINGELIHFSTKDNLESEFYEYSNIDLPILYTFEKNVTAA